MFGGGLGGKIFGGGGGGGKFWKSTGLEIPELTGSTGSRDRVLFGTLVCGFAENVLPLFLFPEFTRPDCSGKIALEGFDRTEGLGTAPG